VPRAAVSRAAESSEDAWFLVQKNRKPQNLPAPGKEIPREQSDCKGKCPESTAAFGDFAKASDGYRKPKWIGNFITTHDYPLLAKQQGKDGRVVLSVIIDTEGRVRQAELIEGSYEVLNEVALAKVKEAVFSPAYDNAGQAIACKVRLPIRFELK
jgi:protein TonB